MTRLLVLAALLAGKADAKPSPPAIPPTMVDGRVLKIEVVGSDIVFTAGVGSDQGVTKQATCAFLDVNSKPVPNVPCILIRVDMRATIGKTTATPDQIKSWKIVRFRMPAPE